MGSYPLKAILGNDRQAASCHFGWQVELPNDILVPQLAIPSERPSVVESKRNVAKSFPNAVGQTDEYCYPVTHKDAAEWLKAFVDERLDSFGDFEDAISKEKTYLFHGVLTPMLNIGLLTPEQIIRLVVSKSDEVSLNSLEGFVRQVIGWREFIRLIYIHAGSRQRTTNAWNLSRSLPCLVESRLPSPHYPRRLRRILYLHGWSPLNRENTGRIQVFPKQLAKSSSKLGLLEFQCCN